MPNRWPSIAGHRFGRLLVLDEAAGRAARYRLWRCRCDCGREEDIPRHRLTPAKDSVTACSVCRAPVCRHCGQKMPKPTMARYCSPECRRLSHNNLVREARARWTAEDPAYAPQRAAYDKARLQASPERQASLKAAQKSYRTRKAEDPEWIEATRERKRHYDDARRTDPAWREKQRLKSARQRSENERVAMALELSKITTETTRD